MYLIDLLLSQENRLWILSVVGMETEACCTCVIKEMFFSCYKSIQAWVSDFDFACLLHGGTTRRKKLLLKKLS
jgi:hypothetical protein